MKLITKLVEQFDTVLQEIPDDIREDYTTEGLEKNLLIWREDSIENIDKLRKVSTWNENELALTLKAESWMPVSEWKRINKDFYLYLFHQVSGINSTFHDALKIVFSYAAGEENPTLNFRPSKYRAIAILKNPSLALFAKSYTALEKALDHIAGLNRESDVLLSILVAVLKLKNGTKTSTVISRLLTYILDDDTLYDLSRCNVPLTSKRDYIYTKNQLIAYATNLATLKKQNHTWVLSIHPMDYITMSNGNSWSSCHRIGGGYTAGTITLMNKPSSTLVAYRIKEDSLKGENWHLEPKIERFLVHISSDGTAIFTNRSYSSHGSACPILSTSIAKILLGDDITKRDTSFYYEVDFCEDNYLGYCDWASNRDSLNWYTNAQCDGDPTFEIGADAYCLDVPNKRIVNPESFYYYNDEEEGDNDE